MRKHPLTSKVRLSIPYFMYSTHPTRSIKQLLSHNIKIHSYTPMSIITNDETVIVDVIYSSIAFSPLDIYYIQVSSLKKILPDSDKYAVAINDIPVKVTIPSISDFSKVVPLRIRPTLANNFASQTEQQLSTSFAYYATVVTNPLTSLTTPFRYPNHSFTPFRIEKPAKKYDDAFIAKCASAITSTNGSTNTSTSTDASTSTNVSTSSTALLLTPEQTLEYYKQSLSSSERLSGIDHIAFLPPNATALPPPSTSAYIVQFDVLHNLISKTEGPINAIIHIQPRRLPDQVLYFPTDNYTLIDEEIESIKDFIEYETINFYNYIYTIDVENA